jgi:hypothetical protein
MTARRGEMAVCVILPSTASRKVRYHEITKQTNKDKLIAEMLLMLLLCLWPWT